MDKIIEFHLESTENRSSLSFSVEEEGRIILPIQAENSNKLATSFIAPKRELDVLLDMLPEDTGVHIHDGENHPQYQADNQIRPYSDSIAPFKRAVEKKHISILVLDPFVFDRKIMSLIEYQVRVLRVLLAQKNIACTFHKAYGVNSANYQSYKSEAFAVFEGSRFPLPVFELNKFDIVLNFEGVLENMDTKTPFFDAVNEFIVDFKPEK